MGYSLAGCYYVLPVMLIISFFISWKIAVIVAAAFIVSLVVGAVSEADDIGPR
jgi:Ca2+/H+ antiporter